MKDKIKAFLTSVGQKTIEFGTKSVTIKVWVLVAIGVAGFVAGCLV